MGIASAAEWAACDRLSKRNFDRLSRFIFEYSGIKMPASKSTMLEGRLRRRLRGTGHASLDAYCNYLFEEDGLASETVQLIDVVTTNKTDFFREAGHFDFLRAEVLPALVALGKNRIRAWSAACSTGAEPYTMAMILDQFARASGLSYSVLATDLSTEVLETAQRGIFPREAVAPVPVDLAKKYVMHSVRRDDRTIRIHPTLRASIGFARMNLMDESYPVGEPLDVIFCRNVLIYFDRPTQIKVLTRLCRCLAPGGHLFIGHSESIAGVALPVKTVANTVFQKRETIP